MKKPALWMSLTQLEGQDWGPAPDGAPGYVLRCHSLRHEPVMNLKVEDLRVLVAHDIGLKYLLPLVLDLLYEDPFVEAEFYEGDLLCAALLADAEIYQAHPDLQKKGTAVAAVARHARQWVDTVGLDKRIDEALQRFPALSAA